MKKYYDISVDIKEDMLVYPGDPKVIISSVSAIENGDLYNLSSLKFGSHTGTHMDAPNHFVDGGVTVDQLPLDHFIGKAKVFDMGERDCIDVKSLASLDITEGDIILFKTKNSQLMEKGVFDKKYVYITPEAALSLVNKGIKTVGIDFLTVEQYGVDSPDTHYAFLENNVVILEGLNLTGIKEGEYHLISQPLKIKNGNGSPMRAILVQDE